MSFKDLVHYLVLAVIAVGVVLALTALSGGISGAINSVVSNL
jgi:Flp pilus assembly pilin Flp